MDDVGLQCGLIAEEVVAVNPDLVVRDKNGEIYTVRYDAVNTMCRAAGAQETAGLQIAGARSDDHAAKEGIASGSRASDKK